MLLLQGGQLFLSIQEVGGYLVPSIVAVFTLGMFWTRCNEKVKFAFSLVVLLFASKGPLPENW